MLYTFLKYYVRLGLRLYCRKIVVNKPEMTRLRGPLLIAANHPNSFLDAVILDILFDQPIHSLARGDVFINRWVRYILRQIKILPVYRPTEGVENLGENYKTFEACVNIFREGGIVLIFSEGLCVNEWYLRKLKKGTARLAVKSWESGIPLRILPTGINYSSFRRTGKNVWINFGNLIESGDVPAPVSDGARHQHFNARLFAELESLVWEIPREDRVRQEARLTQKPPAWKYLLLTLPALWGWIGNAPFYFPLKIAVLARFGRSGHFDSVMMALLIFLYPFYLLLAGMAACAFTHSALGWLLLPSLPLGGWCWIQLKPQLDR